MMQPVYLNAPGVRRITLEGPALKVQSRDRADRFLPLARLGRIVCRGPVQWSTAALMQCLKHGIPVTFLDPDGREIGHCFSAYPAGEPLDELLAGYLAQADGPVRLADWLRSCSRARLLNLLRRHRLQPPDLRIRHVRRYLWGVLRARRGDGVLPPPALKPLLKAQVGEVLTGYHIAPEVLEPGHDWPGLLNGVSGVLEWDLWRLAFEGLLDADAADHRTRVTIYQRHADWLERRIRDLTARLWRWLDHGEAYTP